MNTIEEKFKKYCQDMIETIKQDDLNLEFFTFENLYDVRLCYHDPISADIITLHIAHSYQSIYSFLLGILNGIDLCRNFATFSIYEQ